MPAQKHGDVGGSEEPGADNELVHVADYVPQWWQGDVISDSEPAIADFHDALRELGLSDVDINKIDDE